MIFKAAILLFWFLGHTLWYSELTSGSAPNHFCQAHHTVWCKRLILGNLHARELTYLLNFS